jgi:hypothetical protein
MPNVLWPQFGDTANAAMARGVDQFPLKIFHQSVDLA